jgi:hypothetical protein
MTTRTAALCFALALCVVSILPAQSEAPAETVMSTAASCTPAADPALLDLRGLTPAPQPRAICGQTFCDQRRQACFTGCPCAEFVCDPVACTSQCICPIWCPPES